MRRFLLLIFVVTMTVSSLAAQETIKFEVSFQEPQAHYIDVSMRVSNIKSDYLDIKMPVWAPGSYLIREFPKNVEGLAAKSNGTPISSKKIDKSTWRVGTEGIGEIEVTYRVYAFEVSVRTSFVDASHAFLSPTGVFMYLDGKIGLPAEVTVVPHASWSRISTGLPAVKGEKNTFFAKNFDILFDSPIEVGNQDVFTFDAAGAHHEVAMVGGGNYDKASLKRDMARIVEAQTNIYGENPNDRYVFIVHNYRSGGGGLEHLNSTVLGASRFAYNTERGYKSFLGLVAHEYFHLWNVKRLRPENLGPFDYSAENYTPNLWISEGFTAYYDNLTLRRCDFYGTEEYLQVLANDINSVENRPGNLIQPLASSSFDAWIKQYRPNENSYNTTVTYYSKGALIAMLLDLRILEATQGKKKLDDVMKRMYELYYLDKDRGFSRAEFQEVAEEIAGVDLDDVFHNVDVAKPIDYNKYLNYAGLKLIDLYDGRRAKTLGVRTSEKDGRHIVTTVVRGTGAWDGGINVGDEIISINGYRLMEPQEEIDRILSTVETGATVEVLLSRDGIMHSMDVEVRHDAQKAYRIIPVENPNALQQTIRKNWLSE